MSYPKRICVSTYPKIRIVISKKDRLGRTGHIDWKRQVPSAVAGVPMFNTAGIDVVTNDLAGGVYLICKSRDCVRHCECCDCPVRANESRLRLVAEDNGANKNFIVVNSQWDRIQGAGDIQLKKRWVLRVHELITVKSAIASVQVFAYDMAFDVNAAALSHVPGVVRCHDRAAEVAVSQLENKTLNAPAGIGHTANGV